MDISLVNPYIRVAMNSVLPAGGEIKQRIIFDYELIYIAQGEFAFNYNGIDYPCKEGQFIFIRPNVSHSFKEIYSDLLQPHIHFDITHRQDSAHVPICFKDRGKLTQRELGLIREDLFLQYPQNPLVVFSKKSKALKLFYEIINDNVSALSRKAKLISLIEMLIGDNFKGVFEQENRFLPVEKQVKAYIDSNQGFSVSLDDLAKHFNYSKCYLDRCFKKRYGIGIISYKNERRMLWAKELLKHNSVTAVSDMLGFSSIYVFSRAFKNHFGISPTALANQKDTSN